MSTRRQRWPSSNIEGGFMGDSGWHKWTTNDETLFVRGLAAGGFLTSHSNRNPRLALANYRDILANGLRFFPNGPYDPPIDIPAIIAEADRLLSGSPVAENRVAREDARL
jgi:hypothetical protein